MTAENWRSKICASPAAKNTSYSPESKQSKNRSAANHLGDRPASTGWFSLFLMTLQTSGHHAEPACKQNADTQDKNQKDDVAEHT